MDRGARDSLTCYASCAPGRIRTCDTRFGSSIPTCLGCGRRLVGLPDGVAGVRPRPVLLMSAVDVRKFLICSSRRPSETTKWCNGDIRIAPGHETATGLERPVVSLLGRSFGEVAAVASRYG
jgi:hypothetical protein